VTLLQRLFSLFSPPPAEPAQPEQETFARLNDLAPLQDDPRGGPEPQENAFICREAVLGRDERVAGYEFTLPQRLQSRLRDKRELIRKVYDEALIRNLAAIRIDTLLGQRLAFMDVSPAALGSPELARLPADNLVLAITVPPGLPVDLAALGERLAQLKAAGYRIAWNMETPGPANLLEVADFLRVDFPASTPESLQALAQDLKSMDAEQRPRLVARMLESYEDFRFCFDRGFDYFHGSFINAREAWRQPGQALNRVQVALILNRLRQGAEPRELALDLRQDPVLTFKLLRYINSPAMGLVCHVESIDQAVVILGREKLYRWLSVLLLHVKNPGYREWVLMEQALVRGAFMERLVPKDGDNAFLTGLLSLLDQLLGAPLDSLLKDIQLPEEVRQALLERQGPLAAILHLASVCESNDADAIQQGATEQGLAQAKLNDAMFQALQWAHEVILVSEEASL
jgi:EAL and modified HD-GYP domain-containing signal transduction protein